MDLFFGRDLELFRLRKEYEAAHQDRHRFVVVEGVAGTGKSRLVSELRPEGAIYLHGKADSRGEPMVVWKRACETLVERLSEVDLEERKNYQDRLRSALGHEAPVIAGFVSNLLEFLGDSDHLASTEPTNSQNRLFYLMAKFISALTSPSRKLVLVLDDIQWADQASLDFLSVLLGSPGLSSLLVVCVCRTVPDGLPAPHLSIQLRGFDLDDMEGYVKAWTDSISVGQARMVAKHLCATTKGNILYTREALELLDRRNLLVDGDETAIEATLAVSESVVSLIMLKMSTFSADAKSVLAVASMLTSTFESANLERCLSTVYPGVPITCVLDVCKREGVLEDAGRDQYRFAHDRIQEAASQLLDEDERTRLQVEVGQYLLSTGHRDDMFAGVNLLNSIPSSLSALIGGCPMWEWNSKAGDMATEIGAHMPAAEYYRRAVEAFEHEHCVSGTLVLGDEVDSMIKLYETAAAAHFRTFQFERGEKYAKLVFENARTPHDELGTIIRYAEALSLQERHVESLDYLSKASMIVKERPYSSKFLVVQGLLRLKRRLDRTSDEELLDLPCVTDERVRNAVTVLNAMVIQAVWNGKLILGAGCILRQIELTLKHGWSPAGAQALSNLASKGVGMGLISFGKRMTSLALRAREMFSASKEFHARLCFNSVVYIFSWTSPFPETMKTLNEGYIEGMRCGDMEFGFLCLTLYSMQQYLSSQPLPKVAADSGLVVDLKAGYRVHSCNAMFDPFRAFLLTMCGRAGDAFWDDVDRMLRESDAFDRHPSRTIRNLWTLILRMKLAYFKQDLATAERCRVELLYFRDDVLAFAPITQACFFSGLVCFALYRKTQKRRHLRRGRKEVRYMSRLTKTRGRNSLHYYTIMEAESWTCSHFSAKYAFTVQGKYEHAISLSERSGFIKDAAVANELLALYYQSIGEKGMFQDYMSRAYELFANWGAKLKTDLLKSTYGDIIYTHDYGDDAVDTVNPSRVMMTGMATKLTSTVNRSGEDFDDMQQFSNMVAMPIPQSRVGACYGATGYDGDHDFSSVGLDSIGGGRKVS